MNLSKMAANEVNCQSKAGHAVPLLVWAAKVQKSIGSTCMWLANTQNDIPHQTQTKALASPLDP